MGYGICNLSVIPVRSEPSEKSEMVSQVLFGELLEIIQMTNNWCKVRLIYDNYEGWVDIKQIIPLSEESYSKINDFPQSLTLDLVQILVDDTRNGMFPVVLGSCLPNLVNNTFYIDQNKYTYEGQVTDTGAENSKENIIENAYMYLNTPYLWGGRSPFGIDCSGFTQMVYKLNGIKLLRDAKQQAKQGETLNLTSEAEPGDLAFFDKFDSEEENITHVGIILKNNKIIHASGKVRIDTIDHQGIFNTIMNKYTHKLRIIKKII